MYPVTFRVCPALGVGDCFLETALDTFCDLVHSTFLKGLNSSAVSRMRSLPSFWLSLPSRSGIGGEKEVRHVSRSLAKPAAHQRDAEAVPAFGGLAGEPAAAEGASYFVVLRRILHLVKAELAQVGQLALHAAFPFEQLGEDGAALAHGFAADALEKLSVEAAAAFLVDLLHRDLREELHEVWPAGAFPVQPLDAAFAPEGGGKARSFFRVLVEGRRLHGLGEQLAGFFEVEERHLEQACADEVGGPRRAL